MVVALPGSGVAATLRELRDGHTGLTIVDFHRNAHGGSGAVNHSRHFRALVEALRAGHHCVITDSEFCDPVRRRLLEHTIRGVLPAGKIQWIYFENAPEKCERNIRQRDDAGVEHDLRMLSEIAPRYLIPDNITTLSVSQPGPVPTDVVMSPNESETRFANPRTDDDTAIVVVQARLGSFIVISPTADNQTPDGEPH